MPPHLLVVSLCLLGLLGLPASAEAQQLLTTRMLSLEGAKQIAVAAEAEAARNDWNVALAIVDATGELILFHRRDGTQAASLEIAIGKARTAARFRRPTKALEDAILDGRTSLLMLGDVLPLEGGLPILVEGEVVGGIGVSGVTAQQDAEVARAGLAALRPGVHP
jgi:glc operon protein GlcG